MAARGTVEKRMTWKGKRLENMGEIFKAALTVRSQEEAKTFLSAYVKGVGIDEVTAKSNLGYFAGYYTSKERKFIAEMFQADHPIFGKNLTPSPKDAFEAGKRIGEAAKKTREGSLRVWHIPQIPGTPFQVVVGTLMEAKLLLNTLADYDNFQLLHKIKPDFSNVQGLEVYRDGAWEEWENDKGEDISTVLRAES